MDEVDAALGRLERAVGALGEALEARDARGDVAEAGVAAERDALAAEVAALRQAHEKDAELRAEAAEAVKAALSDLRTLMPQERAHG